MADAAPRLNPPGDGGCATPQVSATRGARACAPGAAPPGETLKGVRYQRPLKARAPWACGPIGSCAPASSAPTKGGSACASARSEYAGWPPGHRAVGAAPPLRSRPDAPNGAPQKKPPHSGREAAVSGVSVGSPAAASGRKPLGGGTTPAHKRFRWGRSAGIAGSNRPQAEGSKSGLEERWQVQAGHEDQRKRSGAGEILGQAARGAGQGRVKRVSHRVSSVNRMGGGSDRISDKTDYRHVCHVGACARLLPLCSHNSPRL